jgi:hypothetical protein
MNALIFLKKRFKEMGQFRAIRDFFDTLLLCATREPSLLPARVGSLESRTLV